MRPQRAWITKPPLGIQLNWAHPLSSGIAGCWALNEGAGGTLYNLGTSNGNNNGTATASRPTWVNSGRYGKALSFAGGSSQGFDCGPSGNMGLLGAKKATLFAVGNRASGAKWVAGKAGDNDTNGNRFNILAYSDNNMYFQAENTNVPCYPYAAAPTGNFTACLVFDGSLTTWAQIAAYTNGRYLALDTNPGDSGGPPSGALSTTAGNFQIGECTSSPQYTTGRIDLVILWVGRALTAQDVANLHVNPWQIFTPQSMLWWPYYTAGGNTYNESGSAGISVGGFADWPAIFGPTPAAGINLGTVAANPATFAPAPSGGIVMGSSASYGLSLTNSGAAGIVLGTVANNLATFVPTPAGGVVLGTVAAAPASFTPGPSGGLIVGGHDADLVTFVPDHGGGIVLGGLDTITVVYAPANSGGIVLGGHDTDLVTFALATQGGVVIGGQESDTATFIPVPSGGIVLGGLGSTGNIWTESGSAGIAIGSPAAVAYVTTLAASGGIMVAGADTEQATFTTVPAGGVVIGSYAPPDVQIYTESGSGGIVLGSTATIQATLTIAPSGGLVLGGYAASAKISTESASGGIGIGAPATYGAVLTGLTSAGIVIGGTSPLTSNIITESGSAGITIGSRADLLGTFTVQVVGGVVVGGHGDNSITPPSIFSAVYSSRLAYVDEAATTNMEECAGSDLASQASDFSSAAGSYETFPAKAPFDMG